MECIRLPLDFLLFCIASVVFVYDERLLISLRQRLVAVYYGGIAYRDEIYTRVRWAWLAFPDAMLVGTCLLMLATVWRTERSYAGP